VSETIDRINEALRDKEIDQRVKQKLNYAKEELAGETGEYEEERNS